MILHNIFLNFMLKKNYLFGEFCLESKEVYYNSQSNNTITLKHM